MKKYTALLAILLAGCVSLSSKNQVSEQTQLQVPKSIKYREQSYSLKSHKDLGSMAHYVYFKKKENGKNWKSAVEILHDRNLQGLSLEERIALREKVYQNNGLEHFNLTLDNEQLYAFVIYAPNKQQNNWQIEVARGAEVEDCGFVQYQYSLKVPQSQKLANMGKVKLVGYLKKYAIDPELARLRGLAWNWHCEVVQPKKARN